MCIRDRIGGAVGVAVLGTVFFAALTPAGPVGAGGGRNGSVAQAYGDALAQVMPWQVATYLLAAAVMLALPRTATTATR